MAIFLIINDVVIFGRVVTIFIDLIRPCTSRFGCTRSRQRFLVARGRKRYAAMARSRTGDTASIRPIRVKVQKKKGFGSGGRPWGSVRGPRNESLREIRIFRPPPFVGIPSGDLPRIFNPWDLNFHAWKPVGVPPEGTEE